MSNDEINQNEEKVKRTPPLPPVPEGMSKKQWKKCVKDRDGRRIKPNTMRNAV